MVLRLVLALLVSPFVGVAALVCSLPTSVLWAAVMAVIGLLGSLVILAAPVIGIVALVALILLVDIGPVVQIARYAGRMTGLAPFDKQPPFSLALQRGILLMVIFKLLLFLVTTAVVLLLIKYGGGEGTTWFSYGEFRAMQAAFQAPVVQDGAITMHNDQMAQILLAVRFVGIVFLTVLAIFVVPRALGLGWEYDGTWTISFVLFRVFLVMPVLALCVGVMTIVLVLGADAIGAGLDPPIRPTVQALYAIEYGLYMGAIFVMEAYLLKAGFTSDAAGEREKAELSIRSPEEYRALRESRSASP